MYYLGKEREFYFGKKDTADVLLDLAEKLMDVSQDDDIDRVSRGWAIATSTLLVKLAKREIA